MPDRASPLSAGLRKGFMHEPTLLPSTCFATFLYKPLQSCCVPATTTLLVLVVFNRPLQSCCVPATTTIPVLVVCNRPLQSFCVLELLWVGSFVEIQCKLPSLLFWTMHHKPFFCCFEYNSVNAPCIVLEHVGLANFGVAQSFCVPPTQTVPA